MLVPFLHWFWKNTGSKNSLWQFTSSWSFDFKNWDNNDFCICRKTKRIWINRVYVIAKYIFFFLVLLVFLIFIKWQLRDIRIPRHGVFRRQKIWKVLTPTITLSHCSLKQVCFSSQQADTCNCDLRTSTTATHKKIWQSDLSFSVSSLKTNT